MEERESKLSFKRQAKVEYINNSSDNNNDDRFLLSI